jgi:hypothetical protein
MDRIPITFLHNGKQHKGYFHAVAGAGGGVWNLMVDRFYWGRLRQVGEGWAFDSSKDDISYLVDYFAAVVVAWYQ